MLKILAAVSRYFPDPAVLFKFDVNYFKASGEHSLVDTQEADALTWNSTTLKSFNSALNLTLNMYFSTSCIILRVALRST